MKLEFNLTQLMRPSLLCLGLSISFVLASNVVGQVPQKVKRDDEVTVKTWSRGTDRISEKVYHLLLSGNYNEYESDVVNTSQSRKFKLRIERTYTQTPLRASISCWVVSLHEVISDNGIGGNIIGTNMLSVEGEGSGDSISREDRAGSFCSIEKPNRPFDDAFYPIDLKRTFLVENFSLVIKATKFQYDEAARRLNSLDLDIQFKNR